MSRQRKVVITVTYNDLGIIVDTKAEELDLSTQPYLQPTCNQLATDTISRQAAIDAVSEGCQEFRGIFERCKEKLLALSSEQPETPCYLDSPCEYQNKDIKLPSAQLATDINVGDTFSRKGVFIPDITVEMLRQASLEGVEDLMASGKMEDISLPFAQPERKKGQNDQPESAKEYCAECDHIEMCGWYPYEGCEFRSIPQPQRKTGKWIKISSANIYECSECGKNVMTDDISAYDFCHGCGARMDGESE